MVWQLVLEKDFKETNNRNLNKMEIYGQNLEKAKILTEIYFIQSKQLKMRLLLLNLFSLLSNAF